MEEYARGLVTGGTLFEELGFFYVGPIDGHNLDHLLPVLRNVRDAKEGPIVVHVVTQKGKGYAPAEASQDKYHGVVKFDVATGKQIKAKANAPSYTTVFGQSLVKEAKKDDRIVAITAAMPSGTGIDIFAKEFPNRTYDVGIAEQHGVIAPNAPGIRTRFTPRCNPSLGKSRNRAAYALRHRKNRVTGAFYLPTVTRWPHSARIRRRPALSGQSSAGPE